MKRRSQKEPVRNHEMEKLHDMTHVTLTPSEMLARLKADKTALEQKLAELFTERNTVRKFAREQEGDDPEYLGVPVSVLLKQLGEHITHTSAQLREVKEKM